MPTARGILCLMCRVGDPTFCWCGTFGGCPQGSGQAGRVGCTAACSNCSSAVTLLYQVNQESLWKALFMPFVLQRVSFHGRELLPDTSIIQLSVHFQHFGYWSVLLTDAAHCLSPPHSSYDGLYVGLNPGKENVQFMDGLVDSLISKL